MLKSNAYSLIMVVSSDLSRRFFSKQAFFIDFLARITQLRMGELNESICMLLKPGWPCWLMPPYQWNSSNMPSRQLHFSSIECQVRYSRITPLISHFFKRFRITSPLESLAACVTHSSVLTTVTNFNIVLFKVYFLVIVFITKDFCVLTF